jgi:uncharacterized protein DUF4238
VASHEGNHVVQAAYQRQWARDGRLQCVFVASGRSERISPSKVAVRNNFYVIADDPGERSTSYETGMQPLESSGIELLRNLEEHWPLNQAQKALAAEYLALCAVRSPAWRDHYEKARLASLAERRSRPGSRPEVLNEVEAVSATDAHRLELMAVQQSRMITVIGSMHWTLVRFRSPRLLTSDHPLVPVPVTVEGRAPAAAIPEAGFLNTVEYRFPVDPQHALVCCWRQEPDRADVVTGARHHLRNLNSATRAQAEICWMHVPGQSPPFSDGGSWLPLSFELSRGYTVDEALASPRRLRALEIVEELIEIGRPPGMAPIVTSLGNPVIFSTA